MTSSRDLVGLGVDLSASSTEPRSVCGECRQSGHNRMTCPQLQRAPGARTPSPAELAARAAHDENITYRAAAERFGVSYESIGLHYRRLYPAERRTTAGPRSRVDHVKQTRAEHLVEAVLGEDVIAEAATIRERIDALEVDTKQFEKLRAEIDERLVLNRTELVLLRDKLTVLRKERTR